MKYLLFYANRIDETLHILFARELILIRYNDTNWILMYPKIIINHEFNFLIIMY